MTPADDSPIWDLLARWEHAARQGHEPTPEELAADRPDLLPELRRAISGLKTTDWLNRPLSAFTAPASPPRCGDYELLSLIGSGGMGRVFKARHPVMDRVVALKVLTRGTLAGADAERFQNEVRAAAKLTHPNVVAAYDAGLADDGTPYLVMEFVDGPDLSRVIRERGPMTVEEAVHIVTQVATALAYADREGILHLDVKPANLLRGPDGVVKLLDLGLARRREAVVPDAALMGTADYLAPELSRPDATADERADIYALGCTLYHLLVGRPPFTGSIPEVIQAHRDAPVPSLREARPDVPAGLDRVFQKMTAKQPEDRYPSMAEVVRAVEMATRTRRAWRWPAAVAILGLASVGIALRGRSGSEPDAGPTPVTPVPAAAAPAEHPRVLTAPVAGFREAYRAVAHKGAVRTVAFTADGTVFTGGDDRAVVWHDLGEGKVRATLPQTQPVTAVVRAGDRLLVGTTNGQVRVWTLTGSEPKELTAFARHDGAVTVAASADARLAVTGDSAGAFLWDLAVDKPRTVKLPQTPGSVLAVRFLPGGREFAVTTGGGTGKPVEVWLWRVNPEAENPVQPLGIARPKESAGATAFAVNGRVMLAAVGAEVYGWAFGSGQAVGIYRGHAKPVRYLAVAGTADTVVSVDDGAVHAWDAGSMTGTWQAPLPGVTAAGISDDGRRVAVGTGAGEVHVFQSSE